MNCPVEVSEPILEIIKAGLLNIRSLARSNGPRCAVEADHLHNLPGVLSSYTPDLLKYYLEVEQPIFVKSTEGEGIGRFEEHWKALRSFLALQSKERGRF
jgi:hypothetical protein